ncbi:MAG: DUF433 domain-containing protein [Gemmataceae bacterium]|nr:DUF433 domain-containing protein [Gemmataceae bacterium]MCI0742928.1 DUF433 domain-containing protein [Gemmataceae bacterium]
MASASLQHIEKTPGVCGGRARIAGHRIRVSDIVVWHEKRGYCPDEIVEMFPGITLADVYAALTYYFDNRQEIEDDWRQAEEAATRAEADNSSKIPTELRRRKPIDHQQ